MTAYLPGDRVVASVPRHEWETDCPTRITVTLGETR